VVIVESSAYLGSYARSPFVFKRNWEVVGGVLDSIQNSLQSENNLLKSSLDDLKSQMSLLVNIMQSQNGRLNNVNNEPDNDTDSETDKSKKRRKGKNVKNKKLSKKTNSSNTEPQQPQQGSSSLLGRLYSSFQGEPSNLLSEPEGMSDVYSDFEVLEEPRAEDISSGLPRGGGDGTTTNYWITNIELELMSSPLDQFNSRSTEDEAMSDYVRLQKSLNQFNQVLSCGLTYDHFLKGAFIAAFDLTTNQQPGLAYAVNTVRTGENYFNIFF